MSGIELGEYKLNAEGSNEPPKDMMEAARRSLSEEGFRRLMLQTGNTAPSPRELCAYVDAERASMIAPDAIVNVLDLKFGDEPVEPTN